MKPASRTINDTSTALAPGKSNREELRQNLRLALPLIVVFAGSQFMAVVDTIIVGHLGAVELAAVGLGGSLFIVIAIIGVGFVLALDPLASQAIGAGDRVAAKRHFLHTNALSAVITLPLTVLILLLYLPMDRFIEDPKLLSEAFYYTVGRLPGLLPFLLFIAHRSYLQSLGTTRSAMIAVLVGNIINVPTSLIMAHGDGVFEWAFGLPLGIGPGWGPMGVGFATSFVMLMLFLYMRRALKKLPDPGDAGPIQWKGIRTILRVGFPVGIHLVAEIGIFATASVVIGSISTLSLAAHQVALQLASLTFTMALGVSSATSTRVGYAVGRERLDETRRAGWVGMIAGCTIMTFTAIAFLLFAEPLASLMCTPAVVVAAIPLIHIAAVFQISDGIQTVASGALRGAGETTKPMVANLVGHWLLGMPLGLYLAYKVMTQTDVTQASGIWWGLTTGLTLVAVALTATFYWLTRTLVKRVDPDA